MANVISVEEARNIIREHVKPGAVETVPVLDAVGRVLAADLFSDINVTPFDDSAMDGFGVVAADLEAATPENPVQLQCVAYIGAGSICDETIVSGQTVRIMTGAPVPDGVDAVVKIEDVTWQGSGEIGDAIQFIGSIKAGKNIRKAGEEAKAGDKVMEAGDVITPAGTGLLAACGNLNVPVYVRPKVGLITIGSELVDASEVPTRGMIRNSNIYALQANAVAAGAIPVIYPMAADDAESIKAVYAKAAEECDIVVSTGGACDGDFDLTPGIVRELGCIHFTRADVKPGKSQPFGEINGKPVFILSGNPAASSVGFELYVRLALRIMQGYTDLDRPVIKAAITKEVRKKDARMFLERGIFTMTADGKAQVTLMKNQSSALYGALQKANCMVVIPSGLDDIPEGGEVTCVVTAADEGLPIR